MRKFIDMRCDRCSHVEADRYIDVDNLPQHGGTGEAPCGGQFVRVLNTESFGRAAGVIGDDIPGGVLIKHGICNEDGSARRYYSKTEIRQAAAAKGLSWGGDHTVHVPQRGSDKSPHTSRWV